MISLRCTKYREAFTLLYSFVWSIKTVYMLRTPAQLEIEMMRSKVIPDVIRVSPRYEMKVVFRNWTMIDYGNKIYPNDMRLPPTSMSWPTERNALYTVIFTDPDVPTRLHPDEREWMHWIVANIPGTQFERGDVLADYIGPLNDHLRTWHRYVFVVFKQKGREDFRDWMFKDSRPIKRYRAKFSTTHFTSKYNLGDPIAGNYFLTSNMTLDRTTTAAPVLSNTTEIGIQLE